MVKIKKSSDELVRFLSRVYVSPKHAASFTVLDKLYSKAKNQFPSVMRKEIRNWAENNLSYSLHKPSRRTFKRNKVYAPKIDSLWEADLAFVQDVAKESDGVNYLLVVIDVLSKYVWVKADFLSWQKSLACSLRIFRDNFSLLSPLQRVLAAWFKIFN